MLSLIHFYLFEEEADLLDRFDKVSNIVFALSTFVLSIFIFTNTINRDNKKDKQIRKMDFLKSLLLDNNGKNLYFFYENVLNLIQREKNKELNDDEKSTLIALMEEEVIDFRLKFYDLILPFNAEVYKQIKEGTDSFISELIEKIVDENINYLDENYIHILESILLKERANTLKKLMNID